MLNKIKSESKGWEFSYESETLIVYNNIKCGFTITITDFKGKWLADVSDKRFIVRLNPACDKNTAITKAKEYMRRNPNPYSLHGSIGFEGCPIIKQIISNSWSKPPKEKR